MHRKRARTQQGEANERHSTPDADKQFSKVLTHREINT